MASAAGTHQIHAVCHNEQQRQNGCNQQQTALSFPLLSPAYAPPAGFSGGAETESTRKAKEEERVASKSQSCKREAGAERRDGCVAAHWVCDTASLSKNKQLPKGLSTLLKCMRDLRRVSTQKSAVSDLSVLEV